MKIKDGVRFRNPELAMAAAIHVVKAVYQQYGFDCEISGGNEDVDGVPRRPSSMHYWDGALDFKMNHVPDYHTQSVISDRVRFMLGDGFDVILHGEGQNIHLHVEYDPKD